MDCDGRQERVFCGNVWRCFGYSPCPSILRKVLKQNTFKSGPKFGFGEKVLFSKNNLRKVSNDVTQRALADPGGVVW